MSTPRDQQLRSISLSIITGNILDHYDTNLYSFLTPILAPLFFPKHDPIVGLILSYGLMSCSVVTKPLGIFYFAKLAWNRGAKVALSLSLFGVALCTALMGCVPTHNSIGIWAPVCLGGLRAVQGFFAGGEDAVTGLYLMESSPPKQRNLASGIYQSSTVLGILLASMVGMICASSVNTDLWRVAFYLGGLAGFVGLYLRWSTLPRVESRSEFEPISLCTILNTLKRDPFPVVRIACVSSLSYVTYAVPFVFLNSFAGLASHISYETMMFWNTILLVLDMILCPLFVVLIHDQNRSAFMQKIALILGVSVLPVFALLPGASLEMFLFARIWIVLLGLAFLAPMFAWFYEVTEAQGRYLYKGLGSMMGTECLGRPTTAICLWLWFQTGSALAPAGYVTFVCGVAYLGLRPVKKLL